MTIKFVGTPNFTQGRAGFKPIAIVNHITAGAYPGCLNWMQNKQAQASSNYLITRKGEVLQLVKDEDTAWANGKFNGGNWKLYKGSNPNFYTLSIEHEGHGAHGGDGFLTKEQFEASVKLHLHLMKKWKIPLTAENIIGHYRLDPINRPNCPGKNFPWKELFKRLEEINMESIVAKIKYKGKVLEVPGYNIPDEKGNAQNHFHIREVAKVLNLKTNWDAKNQVIELE